MQEIPELQVLSCIAQGNKGSFTALQLKKKNSVCSLKNNHFTFDSDIYHPQSILHFTT